MRQQIAGLQSVSKRYGATTALEDVSFSIGAGELVAVLGPNGAGKTTAVKLLLGLAQPSSGTATLFGESPESPAARRRTGAMLQVGRVPETIKVREHIDLFSSYYPHPLPSQEVLRISGLTSLRDRIFGALSGGERQRVLFAIAICGNPDMLFLDEPTVGLDVESRRALWAEIRSFVSRGKSILLTTHYLEEADALADRIVVINKGRKIAEGTPREIKSGTLRKRVRCTSRLTLAEIERVAGGATVSESKGRFEILTQQPELVVRELLREDPAISDLEVIATGMEEAFLSLTKSSENNQEVPDHASV